MRVSIRPFLERRIRVIAFPYRKHIYHNMPDAQMRVIIKSSIPEHELAADYELELDTRQWLREFWSRSIVAWIALIISCSALAVSVCSFYTAHHSDQGTPKSQNQAAPQPSGKVP